jgi:hypothetical protein
MSLNRDLARICPPKEGKDAWTIEFRPCSVFPNAKVVGEVATILQSIVRLALGHFSLKSADASYKGMDAFYKRVHAEYPMFVPERRLTEKEWYQLVGWGAK